MMRSELIINGIETTLSEVSISNLRDILSQEFVTTRAKLSGTTDRKLSVTLAERLVNLNEIISTVDGDLLLPLAESLTGVLQVEEKADQDGVLRTPMSDEVLLDCLTKFNCHESIKLEIVDSKDGFIRELGLYKVRIYAGENGFERKVWIVPTKNG